MRGVGGGGEGDSPLPAPPLSQELARRLGLRGYTAKRKIYESSWHPIPHLGPCSQAAGLVV